MSNNNANAEFDQYAVNYEDALNKGIAVSGESKEFFAEERLQWLKKVLGENLPASIDVLDFGCGTGTAAPPIREIFSPKRIVGVDPSLASIEEARKLYGAYAEFGTNDSLTPDSSFDLAYCNGVFHHIPLAERDSAVAYVLNSLKPGGYFGFWENNPWNPGTRYVMSRIPFDRDAITLTTIEAKGLLQKNGFTVISTTYRFVFPKFLSPLRVMEDSLSRAPLGAQYLVLCRKDK